MFVHYSGLFCALCGSRTTARWTATNRIAADGFHSSLPVVLSSPEYLLLCSRFLVFILMYIRELLLLYRVDIRLYTTRIHGYTSVVENWGIHPQKQPLCILAYKTNILYVPTHTAQHTHIRLCLNSRILLFGFSFFPFLFFLFRPFLLLLFRLFPVSFVLLFSFARFLFPCPLPILACTRIFRFWPTSLTSVAERLTLSPMHCYVTLSRDWWW